MIRGAGLALALLAACATSLTAMAMTPPPLPHGARAEPLTPAQVQGWASDDHRIVLSLFAAGCQAEPPLRAAVPVPPALLAACADAQRLQASAPVSAVAARQFFETKFGFWRIRSAPEATGFMTGYFEPEFEGALSRCADFPTPLYGRPPELVTRMPGDDWPGLDAALSAARRTKGGLEPFPDRTAIETGALDGRGLEILWMRDPVDRFVLQVQGSGRIRLPDG
ncbi:MAG: MltA domain-containing protein, partial [Bosea sp. (in: a-proteobacteria)]|nr:MltA domain-containing protein [Bosea sp. (in: a-proteobacteria)]